MTLGEVWRSAPVCSSTTRSSSSRAFFGACRRAAVAEAVARAVWPVVTGLGHEIDQSITDVVSHTAVKTPTMAAELLVARISEADFATVACQEALLRCAGDRLKAAAEALRRHEILPQVARRRLETATGRILHTGETLKILTRQRLAQAGRRTEEIAQRLQAAAPLALKRREDKPRRLGEQLTALAASRIREAEAALGGIARLTFQLAPQHLLDRGFSITRDADGVIVKEPGRLRAGDPITSHLAGGLLTSRVEET